MQRNIINTSPQQNFKFPNKKHWYWNISIQKRGINKGIIFFKASTFCIDCQNVLNNIALLTDIINFCLMLLSKFILYIIQS